MNFSDLLFLDSNFFFAPVWISTFCLLSVFPDTGQLRFFQCFSEALFVDMPAEELSASIQTKKRLAQFLFGQAVAA